MTKEEKNFLGEDKKPEASFKNCTKTWTFSKNNLFWRLKCHFYLGATFDTKKMDGVVMLLMDVRHHLD